MAEQSTGTARDEVYTRQGFGQSSGVGERPAVVVVDFTNSFVDPAQFGGGNIGPAVAATARLLAAARKACWPVAYTRVVFADDGTDGGPFARKVPALLTQTENNPATRIVDDLKPQSGDLVLRKTAASAFFGTGLATWLTIKHVDTVIVTGATTSGCVRATTIDSVSHGFNTVVAVDCVGDRAIAPHDSNLFDMGMKYADLMQSAELIEIALRMAG